MDFDARSPMIVLLAGGQGTRLKNIFPDLPKALVPLNGRPFLHHLLTRLRAEGVGQIVLALGSGSQAIRDSAESYGMEGITFLTESQPRGTGGAIADIIRTFNLQNPFLVANADTWWEAPLVDFFALRPAADQDGLLACVKKFGGDRYTEMAGGLTFSGLAWVRPEVFHLVDPIRPARMEDVWRIEKLGIHILPGRFFDYGTAAGLAELKAAFS